MHGHIASVASLLTHISNSGIRKVIFVDDESKNTDAADIVFREAGIPCSIHRKSFLASAEVRQSDADTFLITDLDLSRTENGGFTKLSAKISGLRIVGVALDESTIDRSNICLHSTAFSPKHRLEYAISTPIRAACRRLKIAYQSKHILLDEMKQKARQLSGFRK